MSACLETIVFQGSSASLNINNFVLLPSYATPFIRFDQIPLYAMLQISSTKEDIRKTHLYSQINETIVIPSAEFANARIDETGVMVHLDGFGKPLGVELSFTYVVGWISEPEYDQSELFCGRIWVVATPQPIVLNMDLMIVRFQKAPYYQPFRNASTSLALLVENPDTFKMTFLMKTSPDVTLRLGHKFKTSGILFTIESGKYCYENGCKGQLGGVAYPHDINRILESVVSFVEPKNKTIALFLTLTSTTEFTRMIQLQLIYPERDPLESSKSMIFVVAGFALCIVLLLMAICILRKRGS